MTVPQGKPKRILALDGGGVRGIATVAFLERMESELRNTTGVETLGRHFDLIGGTSVGSIIACMLALDWPMPKVSETFRAMCPEIFAKPKLFGLLKPKFKTEALMSRLDGILGGMKLDDARLKTMLAIVMKRLDTGSPWWIVANNPRSLWWDGPNPNCKNHALRVADLIRASTAAPTVFEPHSLPIGPNQKGRFVDGGLSPFNNPSLALLMLARLDAYGLRWPLGAGNIKMISIGTGSWREPVRDNFLTRHSAGWLGVQALQGMIADDQKLVLALMQWMSHPRVGWPVNAEIGSLARDVLGVGDAPEPLIGFQRYDINLEAEALAPLMPHGRTPTPAQLRRLRSLDDPRELETLYHVGQKAAAQQVAAVDFI